MMLATNKEIKSKEDVIAVAKHYFSRWKIEEYFCYYRLAKGISGILLFAKEGVWLWFRKIYSFFNYSLRKLKYYILIP